MVITRAPVSTACVTAVAQSRSCTTRRVLALVLRIEPWQAEPPAEALEVDERVAPSPSETGCAGRTGSRERKRQSPRAAVPNVSGVTPASGDEDRTRR